MRNESSSLPVSFTVVQNQTQCLWPPVIFRADWRQSDMCVIIWLQKGREGGKAQMRRCLEVCWLEDTLITVATTVGYFPFHKGMVFSQ